VSTIAIQLSQYVGATITATANRQRFNMLRNFREVVLIDYKIQTTNLYKKPQQIYSGSTEKFSAAHKRFTTLE